MAFPLESGDSSVTVAGAYIQENHDGVHGCGHFVSTRDMISVVASSFAAGARAKPDEPSGYDMNAAFRIDAAGRAMWQLVDRYTGKVGYGGGVKAEGLALQPPVIDCSGWAGLLLSTAMVAINGASDREVFNVDERTAVCTWSDRMIEVIGTRTGSILEGDRITADSLPRFALIGLRQGGGAWAANHPRPRGITHVVQVVRRPDDGAPFVSESQGWAEPRGLRLLPLAEWLDISRAWLKSGEAWAVDPFG